jgi:hypothetical protein
MRTTWRLITPRVLQPAVLLLAFHPTSTFIGAWDNFGDALLFIGSTGDVAAHFLQLVVS